MIRIFFHSSDMDGQASGAIAKYFHKDINGKEVKMYPISYEDKFPFKDLSKDDKVVMVDFSTQPKSDMHKIAKICPLVWIDHHKSAIEEVGKVNWGGMRDIKFAGCELTWKHYFSKEPIPKWVELLGRFDIWDNSNEGKWVEKIEPFQRGMKIYETDPSKKECVFYDFLQSKDAPISKIIENGRTISQYQKRLDASYMKSMAYPIEFEGHDCIAANYRGNSQSFDSVWDEDKYDFMVMYYHLKKDGKYLYTVSLYTTKKLDGSKIAQKYGGGGHAGSSGFQCSELPWLVKEKKYMKEKYI